MLGKFVARGAAATHRQIALASRRSRGTPASLLGDHYPAFSAGAAAGAAAGLQRQLGTAVDYVDSSSTSGSGSCGGEGSRFQHDGADPADMQQAQGRRQRERQQPAGEGAELWAQEEDRAPWRSGSSSRRRNSAGGYPSGRGRGGGRGRGRGGGEFGRRWGNDNDGGQTKQMTYAREYSQAMVELRRTGNWTRAIEMYTQACDDDAVAVDRMMYNSTIAALARSPRWRVALSILEEMRDAADAADAAADAGADAVTPDAYTFNAALMACAYGREATLAFALLGEMRGAGIAPDAFTFSHLVSICGQEGRWETALSLVDEMEGAGLRPSCVTYNGLIVAFGNAGEPDRAVQVLGRMREEGVQVSEGSYSAAIAACGKAGKWERALGLLEEMKEGRDNLEPNEYCYNSAISACERAARWKEALALLRDMQEAQLIVTGGTYTHVIKACTRAGEIAEARALLDEMRANGMRVKHGTAAMVEKQAERRLAPRPPRNEPSSSPPSPANEAAAMEASSAAVAQAGTRRPTPPTPPLLHAIRAAPGNGVDSPAARPRTLPSWSDALPTTMEAAVARRPSGTPPPSEYCRLRTAADGSERKSPDAPSGRPGVGVEEGRTNAAAAAAAAAVAGAASAVVSPSAKTVPPLPSAGADEAAAAAAAARFSARAAETLAARPRARSVKDFIRAVGGHSRNRRWAQILSDLDSAMANPNIKVSMRMYESCLMGLASGGKWVESLSVLEKMQGAGLKPNAPCLTAAIKACAKANPPRWGLAVSLLQGLDEPCVWAHVAALSALARAGEWKAGAALLKQMRADGVEPNVFCYNGVLEACRRAEPPQWQHACQLLSQMKAEGVAPNEVCYKTAILTCQAASELGEAEALLSEMVEAGFAPPEELVKAAGGVDAECASP